MKNEDLLDVELQMLWYVLVVNPLEKNYTVSIVSFHKYGGANVAVKNSMSQFYIFVLTKATVKLANGNTGNTPKN